MSADISRVMERMLRNRITLQLTLQVGRCNDVDYFEAETSLKLPDEMRTFYSLYSELYGHEDMFRIIPLKEIVHDKQYTNNGFVFAEYMIFSDAWSVALNESDRNIYKITGDFPSDSFADFLQRYPDGGVYEGLYK